MRRHEESRLGRSCWNRSPSASRARGCEDGISRCCHVAGCGPRSRQSFRARIWPLPGWVRAAKAGSCALTRDIWSTRLGRALPLRQRRLLSAVVVNPYGYAPDEIRTRVTGSVSAQESIRRGRSVVQVSPVPLWSPEKVSGANAVSPRHLGGLGFPLTCRSSRIVRLRVSIGNGPT